MAARKPEMIYLIQERNADKTATGYYKVGKTNDMHRRLEDIQTGNPRSLKDLCKEIEVDKHQEKRVHQFLKKDRRIRFCHDTEGGGTEWFYCNNVDSMKNAYYDALKK